MLICISKGRYDSLIRDKSLNPDNAFCFELILMPNFSTSHIGCWDSLQTNIYTCRCLPFNELLSSNCLHLPIKTFAHVTNVVKRRRE